MSVLREAMARDTLDPVGVSFGTETGQLWHSADEGRSWQMVTDTLPEIWSFEAVVLDDVTDTLPEIWSFEAVVLDD